MIKVTLTNEILRYITEIEQNRYKVSSVKLSSTVMNRLRKNSKKKSSYASNKIEGNPLSEKQVDEVIERDERKHYLKPEQEVRNYFLALNFLEEKVSKKEKFSQKLILDVQKLVEKGASKEKIGLRGPMPPGVLFAVYDSKTGNPDYIPPEYCDIPELLDELVEYVNTTDDHPLIVAAVVHYQLVTIHPFEDGNGRTARLLSGYIMDLNGYGFNGIGSLEEYFAYDIENITNLSRWGFLHCIILEEKTRHILRSGLIIPADGKTLFQKGLRFTACFRRGRHCRKFIVLEGERKRTVAISD